MLIMMDYLLTSFERKYSAITKSNLKIITTEDIEYEYQTRNNNTIHCYFLLPMENFTINFSIGYEASDYR